MEGPSSKGKRQSKLLVTSYYEVRDENEEKMENGFALVQSRIAGLSEKDAHDALVSFVSENKGLETVVCGLLFGILTDPQNGQKYFSLMGLISNDNWFCALCNVNMILFELYPRMRLEARSQMMFFFHEAIRSNVPKVDNVLSNLIRNANDGSDLKETCGMLLAVTTLLNDNYAWLSSLKPKAILLPLLLQTFARFISELSAFAQYDLLRSQMITLSVWLLRERFADCAQLGRDLLLVLMRVSKIPQFADIWKMLLYEPSKLAPNFGGVEELMSRPYSNPLLPLYRITVAMQRKMEFMMRSLKPTSCERHLEFFRKHHLNNPEAGNLRAEAVRFAVLLQPSGQESQQPFSPEMRAVVIIYLLSGANAGADQQWCKLHLFWDWLCFDGAAPGAVSFIEPGFTVMRRVVHTQPALINSMLDFLLRMSAELHIPFQERFVNNITNSFKAVGEQLGPISVVLENVSIHKNVREALRETFKSIMRPAMSTLSASASVEDTFEKAESWNGDGDANSVEASTSGDDGLGLVFDEEWGRDETEAEGSCEERINTLLPAVKDEFREPIENLVNSDNEAGCDAMQKLLASMFENDELFDQEQVELISECLRVIYGRDLRVRKSLPDGFPLSSEAVDELFSQPIYVIFRNFCMTPKGDSARQPLLQLIVELGMKCKCVSYLLLFFICFGSGDNNDIAISAYTDVCAELENTTIQQILLDLERCYEEDNVLFAHLVPFVYDKFASEATSSVELLKLVAHSLDAKQIADICGEIIRENIVMFRKESFSAILTESLKWETTAQIVFWQLVHAQSVPLEWVLPALSRFEYPRDAEAISNVYIILQRTDRDPNANLIRVLFSRSANDLFTVNCLKILIRDAEHSQRVAEIIANLIDRVIQSGDITPSHAKSKGPRQRYVSLEHLFAHLDKFRQNCLSKDSHTAEVFLARPQLQEAFNSARTTEKVKDLRLRFNELFAVMEILNDYGEKNSRSSRRAKPQKKVATDASDDEGKSKRKRAKLQESDSE